MSSTLYTQPQLHRLIEAHGDICPVFQQLDMELLNTYLDTMTSLFPAIFVQEHKNPEQFECLKHAFGSAAKGAMKYLDSQGVNKALSAAAPMFTNYSFNENKEMYLFDTMLMNKLGISFEQIDHYWQYIDEQKQDALAQICQPEFSFVTPIDRIMEELGHESGGEEWMHLSPGWFTKIVGAVITVANVTTAVPSCGLSVASVAVGVTGILAC